MTLEDPETKYTVGTYLAHRLEELGIRHFFAVPGDFNLNLLDQVRQNPQLQLISCSNELDAGFAADGYARIHGMAAVFFTLSVGGLALASAVASTSCG